MGLFSRKPDLDSVAGVTDHFLRNDSSPVVAFWRGSGSEKALKLAAESTWVGNSRRERLDWLRADYRLFLAFQMPGSPPLHELVFQVQFVVALAGARSRILGFMWERTYSESMQHLAASWTPMSSDELDAIFAVGSDDDPSPDVFTRAAEDAAQSIRGLPDDFLQPSDKIISGASLRAGARVAASLMTDSSDADAAQSVLATHLQQLADDESPDRLHRVVATLAFHYVLTFGGPLREQLGAQGPEWAEFLGLVLTPGEDSQLDPSWIAEAWTRHGEYQATGDSTRHFIHLTRGVLTAAGVPEDRVDASALFDSMRLMAATTAETEHWKTELRGVGLLRESRSS